MIDQNDIRKIKEATEEFFSKMTITPSRIEANVSSVKIDEKESIQPSDEPRSVIDLDIRLDEPQILIGEKGQTLFEFQRLLRMVLNKRLQKVFYLNVDINDYKKKKMEYLKDLARTIADEVVLTKEEKVLLPMPSYERRVIHTELSERQDIITESQGDGFNRHIVIKPK